MQKILIVEDDIDIQDIRSVDERTEKRNGIFDWNRRWLV